MTNNAIEPEGLPLVAMDTSNRPLWLGLAGIGVVGLLLFWALEANRSTMTGPTSRNLPDHNQIISPTPPLDIAVLEPTVPSVFSQAAQPVEPISPVILEREATKVVANMPTRITPAPTYVPPPINILRPSPQATFVQPPPDTGRSSQMVVYDVFQTAAGAGTAKQGSAQPAQYALPAIAVPKTDRTYVVSQGTFIPAVLETAIDSTQPGQARALVSKNVYNSAGSKILIAKGSRIFGEYKGEIGSGQNRAQVQWTRLVRPDGVTIALDSPATDPLGRAGIKGSVDTHFFERLGNALLQSTIDFGLLAASRSVSSNNGVIIGLPNSAQGAGSQLIQQQPQPTLRVRHGSSIAVLAARDLDFSSVE